jgi:hypothetical protein
MYSNIKTKGLIVKSLKKLGVKINRNKSYRVKKKLEGIESNQFFVTSKWWSKYLDDQNL